MEDTNPNLSIISEKIDPEEMEKVNEYYSKRFKIIMMRYGQKGYMLPENSSNFLTKMRRMQTRPSDIFVASFLKSGTTWTQEMVWLINNDLNFEKAASIRLPERYSFLEIPIFRAQESRDSILKDEKIRKGLEILFPRKMTDIEAIPSPRFFKTHLPMSLLPWQILDTCKVVYIARDPRDVVVSLYYHTLLMKSCAENKTVKDIWNLFIKDQVPWAPYFEHVKEAWNLREHPNLMFLFYEELSKDLAAVLRRVASFFGKELSEDEIMKLCKHLEFKNFKQNPSVNLAAAKKCGILNENEHHIRKGVVGNWIEHFDDEMKEQAERWMTENMRDTDLQFPY